MVAPSFLYVSLEAVVLMGPYDVIISQGPTTVQLSYVVTYLLCTDCGYQ